MKLQLLEIYAPQDFLDIKDIEENFSVVSYWISEKFTEQKLTRILVETNDVEEILNYLEKLPSEDDTYQVMLLPVQTYLPREKKEPKEEEKDLQRASRHELFTTITGASHMSVSYMWFIIFSAFVATVGVIKSSPAVVIGAMVIAPIIGPVTAVSFASVLGDFKLLRRSILTSLFGLGVPVLVAGVFSFLFNAPVNSDEFISRTVIQIIDVIAALASGAAGALSFIKRNEGALVGVMVSVALVPPAVVLGMNLGAARWEEALIPFILLMVNVNSIMLSAVIVFWLSGIKPNNWQDLQKANISRKYSLLYVSIIALVLITAIIFINFV